MILSRRAPSSHIPSPLSSELAPCPLASPPIIPPRPHKHSFSKPMSWLNRSSSSVSTHSISQGTPKTSRISEPKVGSSLDQFIFHRSGQLGSGATIVRTPQEALSGSFRVFEVTNEAQEVEQDTLPQNHTEQEETTLLPPLPPSPPLPPLPDISDTRGEAGGSSLSVGSTSVPLSDHASHSRSSGSTSPKTHRSSSRPTMLAHSRMPSRATAAPVVDTDVVPPQPPFEAILLSPTPDGPTDPSKIIVTLETCTTTYRASLRTLVSRPSHLSRYLTSLLSPVSETASLYSNSSDASLVQYKNGFSSVFRDHFASSGCLPRSPNTIHVFLDRPSAPYTHVLAYLRSPASTPEQPETLPRAVQFATHPPSRLESLLELRDEANYLGLDALYKLCCHEISRVHRGPLPTTCVAGGTLRGKTGSVRSSHTVVETHQDVRSSELRASKASIGTARTTAKSSTRAPSPSSSCENKDAVSVREQSTERGGVVFDVGSPPPGWI